MAGNHNSYFLHTHRRLCLEPSLWKLDFPRLFLVRRCRSSVFLSAIHLPTLEKVGSEESRPSLHLSVHGFRKEIRRLVLLRRYLKVGRGPHKMYWCKSEPGHLPVQKAILPWHNRFVLGLEVR